MELGRKCPFSLGDGHKSINVEIYGPRWSSEMTQVKQEQEAKATIRGNATTLQMRRQTSGINAT